MQPRCAPHLPHMWYPGRGTATTVPVAVATPQRFPCWVCIRTCTDAPGKRPALTGHSQSGVVFPARSAGWGTYGS